jgi:hypothetical protein
MAPDYAGATENQEQVVVSPAQQAVNTAIAGATTAVQEAIDATTGATTEITQAQEELSFFFPLYEEFPNQVSIL